MKPYPLLFSFAIASFIITSCGVNPSGVVLTDTPSVETTVEVTETTVSTSSEAENIFSFNDMGISIGFNYPEGFSQGTNTSVLGVYEPNAPFELPYPQHARILFTAYAGDANDIFADGIRVFRTDEINALEAGVVENLFAVLLGQSDHYNDFPRLAGAGSVIDGQLATGEFQNGNGFRYLNSKSFDASSLRGTKTTYLYQGITDDEKYFVSAVFTVDAPFLADLVDVSLTTPEEYENYFQTVHERVNTASPTDFEPSLTMLDSLISSIVVIEQ